MLFFLKQTRENINEVFNRLEYALESLTFTLEKSRFKYGEDGENEFEFEVDKQLLEAYVEFYSQSNDLNKRNYAQIIKAGSDKTTRQVVKIKPRRNPWVTENDFINEESYGKITYWQLYEAVIDAILSSKILGFNSNDSKYCNFFPKDKYLTFHEEKQYYAPTILIRPETIIELSDLEKLIKILRKEFDEFLELSDILKIKESRVSNYLKVIIKGNRKILRAIIQARWKAELSTLLRDNGFRLWIDSAGFIDSEMYLSIDGYTFECVDEWKKIIITKDIREENQQSEF